MGSPKRREINKTNQYNSSKKIKNITCKTMKVVGTEEG